LGEAKEKEFLVGMEEEAIFDPQPASVNKPCSAAS
jgi:hypothetical protein